MIFAPPLAAIPVLVWVGIAVALFLIGAVVVYKLEVEPDHVVCHWEEAELIGSAGGVCRYRGKDTGIVKEIPLTDIQRAIEDETAACPPLLKLKVCTFKNNPNGAPFVAEMTTP